MYGFPKETELLWRSWEDSSEWIVFNVRSGTTHQLDELSTWLVRRLEAGPLSFARIAECLASEFNLDPAVDPDVEPYLTSLLPRLCELGLVEELRRCS